MMTSSSSSVVSHLVIPGQLIAVSREGDEETSFLRGHGTHIEHGDSSLSSSSLLNHQGEMYLRASVTGTVQRVNKLISVIPLTHQRYEGNVGDLVVGRIAGVSLNRSWKVQLSAHGIMASLPLSGVHLPGGVQRVRTQQDAREMRLYLKEGDLVSAEVHKILNDGNTLQLHTRSTRYGKLENGTLITVPPKSIPKRKNHYTSNFLQKFDVLLGCNGWIWMQRSSSSTTATTTTMSSSAAAAAATFGGGPSTEEAVGGAGSGSGPELAEFLLEQRAQHAADPYSLEERRDLCRLRNAVECLRLTTCQVTLEHMEHVYQQSLKLHLQPVEMLPQVLTLTQHLTSSAPNQHPRHHPLS